MRAKLSPRLVAFLQMETASVLLGSDGPGRAQLNEAMDLVWDKLSKREQDWFRHRLSMKVP